MTNKEKIAYRNTYRIAVLKMNRYFRSVGFKRGQHGIKEWNYIYEFSIMCNDEIQNPTYKKCKDWLYNSYLEQNLNPLKKIEASFYQTIEWRKLRIRVFNKYGYKCLRCGNTDFLHIDHIKPRSLFPELELDINNMQVLCRSCNTSKSNRKFTDYRPKEITTI